MKILYLKTEDPAISHLNYNDFLHDTLLIGLRNNFGNSVVDYPGAWYMYPKERKKRTRKAVMRAIARVGNIFKFKKLPICPPIKTTINKNQ